MNKIQEHARRDSMKGTEGERADFGRVYDVKSLRPKEERGNSYQHRAMACLTVYSTSVTGSREIKSQQSEVTRILDGKNIKYNLVDISQDNALREEMRAKSGNPKAIPPQIFNGDQYCGDYELFVEAVEQNTLQEFLKLA
uniref:SH3 domain-binding glutamic acid-rich-like protein 3 n=1 Tax=Sphaerodactylus townsendi TaxID=933632 RepID=A0ACB8FR62_9SAUR